MAMTLMACYGGPPHAYGPAPAPPPPGQCTNGTGAAPGSPAQGGSNCSSGNGQPTNVIATGDPADQPPPAP